MPALVRRSANGAKGFRVRVTWTTALLTLFMLGMLLALVSGAAAAATTVPLGTTKSFGVLAGSGVTNTGPTTINGDLGSFPTTTITGLGLITLNGVNHAGDAVTQGAKSDLVTAYNAAAGEGPTSPITSNLGGQTLTAGVYNSASSIGLTGQLTLDGGGNPNAVFIFQAGSTVTTASASSINLINGAQSCNVFWQVGSSATLGTGSTFRGTILALTSITVTTGTTVDGRLLARNGAVTLDTDTVTSPTCAAAVTTTATTTKAKTTTTTKAPKTTTTTTTRRVTTKKAPPVTTTSKTSTTPKPTSTPKAKTTTTTTTTTTPTATTTPHTPTTTGITTARLPRVPVALTG